MALKKNIINSVNGIEVDYHRIVASKCLDDSCEYVIMLASYTDEQYRRQEKQQQLDRYNRLLLEEQLRELMNNGADEELIIAKTNELNETDVDISIENKKALLQEIVIPYSKMTSISNEGAYEYLKTVEPFIGAEDA